MADVKWIKITTDIFDDEKILLIESLPDSYAIITVWFKLLCLAGKQNNSGVFMMGRIAYTEKMLATIFRMKESTVAMALQTFEQFGMVEIVDGVITIPNWEKHQSLDKLAMSREQTRQRVARHREKQRLMVGCNASCNADVTQTDKEEEKDIERDIEEEKNNKCANSPTAEEVNSFFDSVWELYPVKKGKGQVSDTKRKKLFAIGYDEISRAVNRYLQELKRDSDWRKPQNGSTFFNSGYIDYLDENFVPDATKQPAQPRPSQQPRRNGNVFLDILGDDEL